MKVTSGSIIAAGALVLGSLVASTSGPAIAVPFEETTEVVPFPFAVESMVSYRNYHVTIPTAQVVQLSSSQPTALWTGGKSGPNTEGLIRSVPSGPASYHKICDTSSTDALLWMPAGTYNIQVTAPFNMLSMGGGINADTVSLAVEPVAEDTNLSNVQINEEEGGLEVLWTNPSYLQRCTGQPAAAPVLQWFRNGYQVGESSRTTATSRGYFIDSLTVGTTYRVELFLRGESSRGSFKMGTPAVQYGTPRIPSVLLMQAPRVVTANEKFPIEVVLQDRKGRPIAKQGVTLTYQPLTPTAVSATASAIPSAKKLKTVRTNAKGVASTKVKLKKTGRVVATFKDSGRNAATLETKKIKVKKRR